MGPLRGLWLKWKMLKLPWRKTFLVGQDLNGNTFWEFKDQINAGRLRRIVKYNHQTHFSDVKVTPQWHQWLRYTRPDPPSIEEQQGDVGRQVQLKYLAQQADERWASKPSFLDKPREQPKPATLPKDPGGYAQQTEPDEKEGVRSAVDNPVPIPDPPKSTKKADPWKKVQGGNPSGKWQPEAWTPGRAKKR